MKVFAPRLYILARNDMKSMSPGRVAAQAAHASTTFSIRGERTKDKDSLNATQYVAWRDSTEQFFGTTLVLGADYKEIKRLVDDAISIGMWAEITNDPTYAVRDGDVTHFLPVDTVAYIFAATDDGEAGELLADVKSLPLYAGDPPMPKK